MKNILLFLLFCLSHNVYAQTDCGIAYPPENGRPDTINWYHFQDTLLPVSHIRNAHPLSAVSYQSRNYRFFWLPVATHNIEAFILRSLVGMGNVRFEGRWQCSVFGAVHSVIVLRQGKMLQLIFYQPGSNRHIYVADGIKRKKRKTVFKDIEKDLS